MKTWADLLTDLVRELGTTDEHLDVFTGYAPIGAECPYLAIIPGGMETTTADDGVWYLTRSVSCEFYCYEVMDYDLEQKIMEKLDSLGYIFTVSEPAYDDGEKFYLTVFTFEVKTILNTEE